MSMPVEKLGYNFILVTIIITVTAIISFHRYNDVKAESRQVVPPHSCSTPSLRGTHSRNPGLNLSPAVRKLECCLCQLQWQLYTKSGLYQQITVRFAVASSSAHNFRCLVKTHCFQQAFNSP